MNDCLPAHQADSERFLEKARAELAQVRKTLNGAREELSGARRDLVRANEALARACVEVAKWHPPEEGGHAQFVERLSARR